MGEDREQKGANGQGFATAVFGTAILGAIAYGLSIPLETPLRPQMRWSLLDAAIGVAATAPLALFLAWFMRTGNETLSEFRRAQIKFFAEIGFEFTWPRIAVLAFCAGVFEELLFRGLFQTWATGAISLPAALILTNIAFGVVHMRTWLYAVIAGLVGLYLGILFAATGNLLVPMIAHGLYDLVAFAYTKRAIATYRADQMRTGVVTGR